MGYLTQGIDFWIGLSRPDKPFYDDVAESVDVLICNERAFDK